MGKRENDSALGGKILMSKQSSVNQDLATLRRQAIEILKTPSTKISGDFLVSLHCPFCGQLKASAHAENPGRLYCWSGSCVASKGNGGFSTDEHFGISIDYEKSCPPSSRDKQAPATAFLMQQRGLSANVLKGIDYRYRPSVRGSGIGGVLLYLGIDSTGKETFNGRLFQNPTDGGKSHSEGKIGEFIFIHPDKEIDFDAEVVVVEGWITALSLWDMGVQSVAVFSSVASPEPKRDFFEKCERLTLCFDNDRSGAGQEAMRRWLRAHPKSTPILLPQGTDANDLLTQHGKEKGAEIFRKNRPQYEFNAQLALSESPQAYAERWLSFHNSAPSLFHFNGETFFSQLKTPRGGDQAYLETRKILRGTVTVSSFTVDTTNISRPEFRYNLETTLSQQGRRPIEATATGRDLSTARTLNEFFLSYAKVNFEGDHKAAAALQAKITTAKAPEVQQLTVTGYQPENGAYVFPRWAVDPGGQLLHPDKRGHFRIGHNRFFRPPAYAEAKAIHPETISKEQVREIFRLIHEAWGMNGVAALSWVIAGFFVNALKEEAGFFPFLSLWGDPAAGKSALVVLLNNIQGREGEGLPINQLNSKKGMVRSIGQTSGGFVALLEDSERNEKGFDFSILLTGFNKGPLQIQATFSADLGVKQTDFLGCLLFCANQEPFNSKAERQRVISLQFKTDDLTDTSRAAYEKLMSTGKKRLAGIMQQVLIHRTHFESNWQREYSAARADLTPMAERRILDNHALILGFHRLFCTCFDIRQDPAVTAYFKEVGKRKCISSATRQTTLADHLFELLDTIDTENHPTAYHVVTDRLNGATDDRVNGASKTG